MTTQEKILAKAQELFVTVGYQNTSIQRIIDDIGIAKGTFYHYFKSKDDLLDTLVNTTLKEQTSYMLKEIESLEGNAMDKMNRFYALQQQWKGDRFELLYTVLQVMASGKNTLFIKKNQEKNIEYYGPILSHIIEQGVEEGIFDTFYPQQMGEMVIRLSNNMSEEMVVLFADHDQYEDPFQLLKEKITFHSHCIERLIGSKPGYHLVNLVDFDMIERFFEYLKMKG